jgi:hypothetical protein
MMGMGVELGALGVSRVFNIIRIDFVGKRPAGSAAGSDRWVSAAAAAVTGIGMVLQLAIDGVIRGGSAHASGKWPMMTSKQIKM